VSRRLRWFLAFLLVAIVAFALVVMWFLSFVGSQN